MATRKEINDAIVARLNNVTAIGKVHGFERYVDRESVLKELYQYENELRAWDVRRIGHLENQITVGRVVVVSTWDIRGYMSLSDKRESQLLFDDLCDAVVDEFRTPTNLLPEVTMAVNEQAGMRIIDAGPVLLAGVLCHSARMRLFTREVKSQ